MTRQYTVVLNRVESHTTFDEIWMVINLYAHHMGNAGHWILQLWTYKAVSAIAIASHRIQIRCD